MTIVSLPQVIKWSAEKMKILEDQAKVRMFYFELGKINILKKSHGWKN